MRVSKKTVTHWFGKRAKLNARIREAWRARGPVGAVETIISAALESARWRIARARDRAFDHKFGVSTAGDLGLRDLDLTQEELDNGTGVYRPVWGTIFHSALRGLPINYRDSTFVDYGSGKGKALLLASDYPFKRILGVEYSRPLHDVAEKNIRLYRNPRQKCHELQAVHGDALKFELPEGPVVVFLYNPFAQSVLHAALQRIVDSVIEKPRQVFIVSVNARSITETEAIFRSCSMLTLISRSEHQMCHRVEFKLAKAESVLNISA